LEKRGKKLAVQDFELIQRPIQNDGKARESSIGYNTQFTRNHITKYMWKVYIQYISLTSQYGRDIAMVSVAESTRNRDRCHVFPRDLRNVLEEAT
jgi:hypothetical protein